MRVAMYYNNRDVRLKEVPVPNIGPGELLIKVMASGICGSDVMEWYRIKRAPLVLGHEIAGEIAGVGEGVDGYNVGMRVFASHHVPCNTCRYCLRGHHTACQTLHATNFDPGGFAEYVRLPQLNVETGVLRLPNNVSFEEGTFIEPLACVVRAQRLAGVQPDDTVVVIGSGISGLLHLKLARAQGAEKVIAVDINDYRLEAARRFGADAVFYAYEDLPARLKEINENRLADCVIVCTGALSAFEDAFASVDNGGAVVFFAPTEPGINVPVPVTDLWRKEITLLTSYGASPGDLGEALSLISSRQVVVGDMITHRLGLAETGLGFKLVAEAKDSIKVIIEPQR